MQDKGYSFRPENLRDILSNHTDTVDDTASVSGTIVRKLGSYFPIQKNSRTAFFHLLQLGASCLKAMLKSSQWICFFLNIILGM